MAALFGRLAAMGARTGATAARTGSVAARTGSAAARSGSVAARSGSTAARTSSTAARPGSVAASSGSRSVTSGTRGATPPPVKPGATPPPPVKPGATPPPPAASAGVPPAPRSSFLDSASSMVGTASTLATLAPLASGSTGALGGLAGMAGLGGLGAAGAAGALGAAGTQGQTASNKGASYAAGPSKALNGLATSMLANASKPFPPGTVPKANKSHWKAACPCAGILDDLDDFIHKEGGLKENQHWLLESIANNLIQIGKIPMCKCVDLSRIRRLMRTLKAAEYTSVKGKGGVTIPFKSSDAYKELSKIMEKYKGGRRTVRRRKINRKTRRRSNMVHK